MSELTKEDYKTVLDFYDETIPIDKKKLIKKAEDIISQKLCSCIKKVNTTYTDEPRSVGICKNSVLKKKNLKIYKFTCKKKPSLLGKKTRSKKIFKTGNIPKRKKQKRTRKKKV